MVQINERMIDHDIRMMGIAADSPTYENRFVASLSRTVMKSSAEVLLREKFSPEEQGIKWGDLRDVRTQDFGNTPHLSPKIFLPPLPVGEYIRGRRFLAKHSHELVAVRQN
ncbi:hypothetical protein HYU95_03885 [Candidatus Daviesbacteria bacterium]|nr:hypothetical protein [Candidatus Daviesbacteria bacterium]